MRAEASSEREARLRALEDRLGHRFSDLSLLDRALTHSSRANEDADALGHNEPLEFLGDSVIGFVVADLLHRRDPEGREGGKSKTRAQLVSARSLARRAADFARLYSELHGVARRELARSGAPISLGATTLLHEAYLDMAEREGPSFPDRARFLGYAARVMRGLIIDYARTRRAIKRGGAFEITTLPTDVEAIAANGRELEQIGEALDQLAKVDRSLAEIVDLKFFCGLSFAEVAALQGVTERTVQRRWERARIYLHRTLRTDLPGS